MRFAIVGLLSLLAAGCVTGYATGVPGNGVIGRETREVPEFSRVEIRGAIQATLKVGPRVPLVLQGDENLLPLILTEVREGRLVVSVDSPEGIRPTEPITIEVITPVLDEVSAQGASTLKVTATPEARFTLKAGGAASAQVEGVKTQKLDVMVDGASQVAVSGSADEVKLVASGASRTNLTELAAKAVTVEIQGATSAQVQAGEIIAGDVSGASELRVQGNPASRTVRSSGASRILYPTRTPSSP